jgi:hypothetical protein
MIVDQTDSAFSGKHRFVDQADGWHRDFDITLTPNNGAKVRQGAALFAFKGCGL